MKTMLALSQQRRLRISVWLAACAMAASTLAAQTVVPRIRAEISSSELATLKGSRSPLAQPQLDAGRVPAKTQLTGMSIVFNRSAAQQADLDALIAAQQDPSSPLFHQWLTPDQFAARFGMAQADLDQVQNWLLQQGFSVDWVARSRTMIRFSGTVSQAEQAFSTQLHYYNTDGARFFAPSTDLTVPAALAPVVLAVRNLDNFRPKAQVIVNKTIQARPAFTSSQSGHVFWAPGDIAKMYDVGPVYSAGYNGAGQSIAVVGQSAITVSDVEHFQTASGLTVKDPTMVLVPATGVSTFYSGDQAESDLDLEWSSAMAPGATIYFVYTGGSSNNNGAFDSLQYAVDERIANIISVSYGACESVLGTFSLETAFQQAVVQGQTIISASGDQGSTSCYVSPTSTSPTQLVQQALAVNYPASSPNVTGIGGTEITAANSTTTSGYWTAANGSDLVTSATGYIPEIAWNDDSSTNGLSATGGGKSALFPKPTWQTTLTPADSKRDVPDISIYGSAGTSAGAPGYLYCTSDSSNWSTGQLASCNSGFRDSTSTPPGDLTVAGGTSFGAPVFAGMLALINQMKGYNTGSGNINPSLYTMATSGASYSAGNIFHDIVTGNNECTAGATYCSSTSGSTTNYNTAAGYDLVTGLGSIDLANLATAWTASGSTLIGTTTTITASSAAPAANATDTFTITVVSGGASTTTPTGNVTLQIDGGTSHSGTTTTVALAAGTTAGTATATYQTSFATAGAHQIIAQYPGDAHVAASSGVVSVNVGGTTSGTGTFSIAASPSPLTVNQGSSGNETITITPAGGYSGTVLLTLNSSNNTALTNLCYNFTTTLNNGDGSVTVSGTSPVTTTLTFDTLPSDCGLAVPRTGNPQLHRLGKGNTARSTGINPVPATMAFAGLLLVGFLGRYSRKFAAIAGLFVLLAVGLTITACGGGGGGGGGGTSSTPPPPKGTYTIYVTGQDSVSSTIPAANTTFTFVIQ